MINLSVFQQVKSHLLEISDSLFQLNLRLHSLQSSPSSISPEVTEVEAELRLVYSRWQEVHSDLTRAEVRHQRAEVQRRQGEFSSLLCERLSELNSCKEDETEADGDQLPASGGWWRSVVKVSFVSSLLLASVVSAGLLWSQAKCQHLYYSSVWPMLSYTVMGPRPY